MIGISQVLHPHSIIDFELAGTLSKVQEMLSTWQKNNAMNALFFLLGFDYFFMVTYSVALWFACLHVATKFSGKFQLFLIVLAWSQPFAALLDAIENGALYHLASGSVDSSLPLVAKYAAIPKFVIALAGVLFWIGGSFKKEKS